MWLKYEGMLADQSVLSGSPNQPLCRENKTSPDVIMLHLTLFSQLPFLTPGDINLRSLAEKCA